jgi:predicted phage tail protein
VPQVTAIESTIEAGVDPAHGLDAGRVPQGRQLPVCALLLRQDVTVSSATARSSRWARTASTMPRATTSPTVKGLKNGTGYTVYIRAINANGLGVPSARSAVVIPATTPGRALIVRAKAGAKGGRSTATVTWRAPSNTGGSAITSYRITAVKYSVRGRLLSRTTIVLRSAKVRSAELRLAAGTYRFTVQAVNAVGAVHPPPSVTEQHRSRAPAAGIPARGAAAVGAFAHRRAVPVDVDPSERAGRRV